MTFILFELRKLVGARYIWVFFAVMLAANGALCAYTASRTAKYALPPDTVAEFFELYTSSPERMEEEYTALLDYQEQQMELMREARQRGEFDFEFEPLPSKYIQDDRFTDFSLFHEVFGRKNAILEYPATLQKVINRAYANLAEFDAMGISPESYIYQYQLVVIGLYGAAQTGVRMGLEHTRGWGEYFAYDAVNIFIFAMVIILGCAVFAQEKNSGFINIMRTAKNGRAKTALAKIAAMTAATFAVTLLFTLSTWLVFGLLLGYSSSSNAIQVFGAFTLSPFIISVGQYFAASVAVKLLTFTLFSSVVLLLSVLFDNYVLIYLSGLGFFGLNFLLYTLKFIDPDNPLRGINLVATAAVTPLFERFRSINLFGQVCGYLPFMAVSFILLAASASLAALVIYSRGFEGVGIKGLSAPARALRAARDGIRGALRHLALRLPRTGRYSLSLTRAEGYKTLAASRFILIVMALFLVRGYISAGQLAQRTSYSDAIYNEYMTHLEGELTEEKRAYIEGERAFITDALSRQMIMQSSYLNDEIDYEEYRLYLRDLNYAYSRDEHLKRIEEHLYYIEQTAAAKGVAPHFVYDTGWRLLFHSGFDFTLYAALLLLFAGIFADEYYSRSSAGGFAQILKATKYGRERTFRAKLTCAAFISAVLAAIWNALDLVLVLKNFGFVSPSSPLLSIQSFAEVDGGITIAGYIALFLALRVFGAVILALAVSAASELLRLKIPVLGGAAALTLFPALLAYFGLTAFSYVDFTGLLSATPLWLLSARGSPDWVLLAVFAAAASAAVAAALARARHTFTK